MALLFIMLEVAGIALLSYAMAGQLAGAIHGRGLYYALMAPGTVFHELSHALACLLLGLRVKKVSLFHPRRKQDGSIELGSVEYLSRGRVRPVLVGIAPLVSATVLITFLPRLLLPPHAGAVKLLESPGTYVFIIVAFLLGLALCPSRQDLRGLPLFLLVVALLAGAALLAVRLVAGAERFASYVASMNSFLWPASRSLIVVMAVLLFMLLALLAGRFLSGR